MRGRPRIAYLIEPRFPGGTSSAVARELGAVRHLGRIEVHDAASGMFPGRPPADVLAGALDRLGLELRSDVPQVCADRVIVHNPSFLKRDSQLRTRIVTQDLIVVTHENFLRPAGFESHDVAHCLDLLDRATVALRKYLAPISPHNRETVRAWLAARPAHSHWQVLEEDWVNICDFTFVPPTQAPRDRRGRHSRPGFEKFPTWTDMDLCFPARAEANVILGADMLADLSRPRPHWQLFPFKGLDLASYFAKIDFMVYFTARTFRESFGRVLAEGIAAGKVVISDADTASVFGDAVVAARPEDVDGIIGAFIASPERYVAHVLKAQERLAEFSAESFLRRQARVFGPLEETTT